jgi:hypothetical protein
MAAKALSWTPATFWASTPTEFFDALVGPGDEPEWGRDPDGTEDFAAFRERLERAGVA